MRYTRSQLSISLLLIITDVVVAYVSLVLAYHLRFFSFLTSIFPVTKGIPSWSIYHNLVFFIVVSWIFLFYKYDLYKVYFLPILDDSIRIAKAVSIGVLLLILATFFYRDFSYSRLTFVFLWIIASGLLLFYRQALKFSVRYFLQPFIGRESILVVGKENRMLRILLKRHPHLKVLFSPYEDESAIDRIKKLVIEKNVDQIILTSHKWHENRLLEVYDWCENTGIEIKFVPDIVQLCRGEISIDSSLGIPIFHLKSISLSGFNFYFKRIFDLVISIFFIGLFAPLLVGIALLIKLDSPGPFFYHHKRMGYRSKIFDFYKFRTMILNADRILEKLKQKSERSGPVFKMANDPRVTKIGKVLRRYSLDELPQLLNVLRGEMSLVGPRPQVLWEAAAYDDWARRRLRILPGITGLWQVSGRASLSYEEMIELDIYYIENWSLGLDIKILFDTIPAVFNKKGAY